MTPLLIALPVRATARAVWAVVTTEHIPTWVLGPAEDCRRARTAPAPIPNGADPMTDDYTRTAYDRGRRDAHTAASWTCDGNTTADHAARILRLLADGDPAADTYLPNPPDLSGEWSDAPTPTTLARDVYGTTCPRCHGAGCYIDGRPGGGYVECGCGDDHHAPDLVDDLAAAYEDGVADAFGPAVERALAAVAGVAA